LRLAGAGDLCDELPLLFGGIAMKRLVLVLLVSMLGVTASQATTFQFTVSNQSRSENAKFFVRGAQIEGATRVPSGGKSEVKVTLPDGKCRAELHIDFAASNYLDDDKSINFCKFGGLTVR
jgi:hypothetical protein